MAETPFILQEQQFQRLKNVLARLCVECAARVVFLVDRDGQPIAFHGDIGDMDTTSFSSLAAEQASTPPSYSKDWLCSAPQYRKQFHDQEMFG